MPPCSRMIGLELAGCQACACWMPVLAGCQACACWMPCACWTVIGLFLRPAKLFIRRTKAQTASSEFLTCKDCAVIDLVEKTVRIKGSLDYMRKLTNGETAADYTTVYSTPNQYADVILRFTDWLSADVEIVNDATPMVWNNENAACAISALKRTV